MGLLGSRGSESSSQRVNSLDSEESGTLRFREVDGGKKGDLGTRSRSCVSKTCNGGWYITMISCSGVVKVDMGTWTDSNTVFEAILFSKKQVSFVTITFFVHGL